MGGVLLVVRGVVVWFARGTLVLYFDVENRYALTSNFFENK